MKSKQSLVLENIFVGLIKNYELTFVEIKYHILYLYLGVFIVIHSFQHNLYWF